MHNRISGYGALPHKNVNASNGSQLNYSKQLPHQTNFDVY